MKSQERFGKKRLSVDIPQAVHYELKQIAERYNVSLTTYLLRIIIEKLLAERDFTNQ